MKTNHKQKSKLYLNRYLWLVVGPTDRLELPRSHVLSRLEHLLHHSLHSRTQNCYDLHWGRFSAAFLFNRVAQLSLRRHLTAMSANEYNIYIYIFLKFQCFFVVQLHKNYKTEKRLFFNQTTTKLSMYIQCYKLEPSRAWCSVTDMPRVQRSQRIPAEIVRILGLSL